MYPAYVTLKPPKPITLEKGRGNESADGGAGAAEPPASGSNDTLEPKVLVLSLVLANFVPPPRGGVSWRLAGNEGARRFLPDPSTGPGTSGRAATGPGRNSIVVKLNHPAAAAVIPGNAPPPGSGVRGPGPHTSKETTIQAEGKARRAAHGSPAVRGPHPGCRRPAQTRTRAGVGVRLPRLHLLCHWCSRLRGRRRPPLPRGVAAPLLPRGRGTLPGASAPTSPALAFGRGGLLRPQTRTARRVSLAGLPSPPRPALHVPSGAAVTNTRPPWRRGHRARSPPKRHQRASARGRLQRARRRGLARGVRGRLGAPGPRRGGGDAARPRIARCASPRRGPGGKSRRGGEGKGSVTRFRASQGARSPGPAPPRPAPGLGGSRPPTPFPGLLPPAPGHAPQAPPLGAALRFPLPRLPAEG